MQTLFQLSVKEAMTTHVVTVDITGDVQCALDLMAENHVAALPVVDGHNHCVGILSASDIVQFARELDHGLAEFESSGVLTWGAYLEHLGENAGYKAVRDMMTVEVASITECTSLANAAAAMLREKVHRLPVLDKHGKLLGLLSTTDILRAFVEHSREGFADKQE